MLRGLYIDVIKSLKGRSILPMKVYYLNMQGSLDRGSIPEVSIGTLGCAFEHRNFLSTLGSWLFPLLIIVNKELNKPLQGMAPTLMPSKCPLTSGMLACSLEEFHTHGRTYILTSWLLSEQKQVCNHIIVKLTS